MSNLQFPANPTLQDYQKYVAEMTKERGFKDDSIAELLMLMMEECGELARACRKHTSLKSDASRNQDQDNVAHELADIFLYIISIANKFGIDLERAVREKEEINKKRIWK